MAATSSTSILSASLAGETDTIQRLVNEGADVNVSDEQGNTPAHLCARGGFLHSLKALIRAGASVAALNAQGQRPIDVVDNSRGRGCLRALELADSNPQTDARAL